jgi:hypothetical protein
MADRPPLVIEVEPFYDTEVAVGSANERALQPLFSVEQTPDILFF